MASLGEFARRIRSLGQGVERRALDAKRRVAVVVNQAVVMATPVDTGHARAGWEVGLGQPVIGENQREDLSGQETIDLNSREIGTSQPEQDIYLSNNVPYINRLNEGWSAQAPAGFVEQAAQAGADAVASARLVR